VTVAVLGCGPAGAAAAITLRRAGVEVIIIEPANFPRYRPGETLHPGIEPLLQKLGVAHLLRNAAYLRHPGIWSGGQGAMQFVPYGADDNGAWYGFQAPRGDFDQRLIKNACELGATRICAAAEALEFDNAGFISLQTSGGQVKADWVIDASGSAQVLARWRKIAFTRCSPTLVARYGYRHGTCTEQEYPSLCVDATGWTWIAEVEPNRYQWTRVTQPNNRPAPHWVPTSLESLTAGPVYGADVTWRKAEQVAGPGWFLAGDAAAILDPSSSHGVLRALMCGMMSAHLIIQSSAGHISRADCALVYQHWLGDWFTQDVQLMSQSYKTAGLFGF